MKQADIFLKSEGDAWHRRNKNVLRLPDMVIEAIKNLVPRPRSVLEIGCGNGWRLAEIKKMWPDCHCVGYDPSLLATGDDKERAFPNIMVGDALRGLICTQRQYDMIIFGFCLYLVDREDLLMIAGNADRVLKDGGHIVIHDFFPDVPYRTPYKHFEGIWSYHVDYRCLWLGNPAYENMQKPRQMKDKVGVAILRKNLDAWI